MMHNELYQIEGEFIEGGKMDMYMERILEIYKNPENRGEISDAQIKVMDYNPSCGDSVRIFAQVKNGKIEGMKFLGEGCAISLASASLLSGNVKGRKLGEIMKMGAPEMFKIIGLDLSKNPSRAKCAMLPLSALKKGIREFEKLVE